MPTGSRPQLDESAAPMNRSGSLMAAKWPPQSNADQWTMFLPRSAKRRMATSPANTATPVGVAPRCWLEEPESLVKSLQVVRPAGVPEPGWRAVIVIADRR